MDKQGLKTELRSEIRVVLKTLRPEKRKSDSEKLCANLNAQPFFQNAISILFFAPLPDEVDLWPLLETSLQAEKIVALPRFEPARQSYVACRVKNLRSEIVSGRFNIREPSASCTEISPKVLDLVLVPGVAFDLNGRRLGHGKGYYDRLLRTVHGSKVGIAFDQQMVEKIPAEAHDAQMDFILTPSRCVRIAT